MTKALMHSPAGRGTLSPFGAAPECLTAEEAGMLLFGSLTVTLSMTFSGFRSVCMISSFLWM